MKSKTPNHPLRVWMFNNRLSAAEFADMCDMHGSQITQYINWRKRPSLTTIDRFTEVTKGAITANDFPIRPDNPG